MSCESDGRSGNDRVSVELFRAPDAPHRMLAELPLPVYVTTEDDYLT